MTTNKDSKDSKDNKVLESQVDTLKERVARLQSSNSNLKDELLILKNNYSQLVNEMNERLEAVHARFQKDVSSF
jgi:predicted nuclease with TOPRIM domain